MEEGLIMEIWDTFKEYISEKNKGMAATHFVDFLLGNEIDINTLEGYLGYDPYLDDAIKVVIEDIGDKELSNTEDEERLYEDEDY